MAIRTHLYWILCAVCVIVVSLSGASCRAVQPTAVLSETPISAPPQATLASPATKTVAAHVTAMTSSPSSSMPLSPSATPTCLPPSATFTASPSPATPLLPSATPTRPTGSPSPMLPSPSPTVCLKWFFSGAPSGCPAALPEHFTGAAQRFEHGFILWTAQPDRFYVFVDAQTLHAFLVVRAPYTFQAVDPVTDTPPPGLYEPISGFGKVWRGEIQTYNPNFSNLRALLGWAVEPEHPYETDFQCDEGTSYSMFGNYRFTQNCFLRDAGGDIILLRPQDGMWELWE